MALGNSRPRNGGKDYQNGVLAIAQHRAGVRAEIKKGRMWLHPHNWDKDLELKAVESQGTVHHIRRGRWELHHWWDGRLIAYGVSKTDLMGRAINAICFPGRIGSAPFDA